MFCPTCGTQSPDQAKFCRSCGTDLGVVSGALSGRLLDPRSAKIEQAYWKDLLRGAILVLIFIFVALTGIVLTVPGIDREGFGWGILSLGWMTVAMLLASLIFARRRRKMRRQLLEKDAGMWSAAKETARRPEPPSVVPPPSVAEQTTARLSEKASLKDRPDRDENMRAEN